jgi:hypothetical protein
MTRLLTDDVTMLKNDRIHLHVRLRGCQATSLSTPIPPPSWKTWQTDPAIIATLDRLLDNHTDAGAAAALNATGHRSGKGQPFTGQIVLELRRSHHLPATPTGSAPRACSPSQTLPAASASTSPPSRPGAAPECSPPTRPTTRTSRSSARPRRATPGWSNARAASSPAEFTPQQHQEVQYEAHVLVCGLLTRVRT